MKKRCIMLLLSLVLVLLAIPALAGEVRATSEVDNGVTYYYSVSDGKATITGVSDATEAVTIPSSLGGYPVTSVGDYAFRFAEMRSVTIPNGVTCIGNYAFDRCDYLRSVTIPNSVTSIGSYAFRACFALNSITIPSSVASIGDYAFHSCNNLRSVTISDGVISIGSYAFCYCTGLTSIAFPSSVTSTGSYVFYQCTNLTEITIPDGVTVIGGSAFRGCTNLTEITIPDSVTVIGSCAFSECTNLTQITIPDSVTEIGGLAFSDCTNLSKVTLPNSITCIEMCTFENCDSLTGITIPNSVTEIEYRAFNDCDGLISIRIPDSVKILGDEAFYLCDSLASVYLGKGITSHGTWPFYGCTSLKTVYIPRTFNTLPKYLFYECTALEDIWYAGSKRPGFFYDDKVDAVKNATWHFNYCGEGNHTHDNVCDAVCNICGFTREVPEHVYDLVCDPDCNICGAQRSVRHTYSNSCDTICNICSRERDIYHTYSNSCDTTCNVCKYVREIRHTYSASCDTVCNVCSVTRTTTAEHTYTNSCDTGCNYCSAVRTTTHTYDNGDDLTCNVCKESLKPSAPELESYTTDSITLVAVAGLEYSCGSGSWQSSNVFTGLEPGTKYTFYQRVAASATAKVSESSSALKTYTRLKPPVILSKTDTSITVKVPYANKSFYRLSLDGKDWKTSSDYVYTFSNLTPGTTYTLYQRDSGISAPAGMAEVTTYRHIGTVTYNANGGKNAPAAQTKVEETPLTLSADKPSRSGYVFKGWATTFYGEVAYQPGGEYTQDASLTLYAIWGISCTTCGGDGDNGSTCGNCDGKGTISYSDEACPYCSSTSITQYVTGSGSYYYCRSCGRTFYSAYTVTKTKSCSDCSGRGNILKACSACDAQGWIKDVQKTAPAPTLQSKDYVSVTLTKLEGVEYSMDGTTWQDSNVFARLDPGTAYRFYQRYKETTVCKATAPGAALTVTTNTISAGSVTLKKVDGQWKYYTGSTFVPITTVVSFSGSRYYVEDGVVPTGFTGWKDYKAQRLYLKSGKLVSNGLYKVDGSWYYIKNGALASTYKSFVKHK